MENILEIGDRINHSSYGECFVTEVYPATEEVEILTISGDSEVVPATEIKKITHEKTNQQN